MLYLFVLKSEPKIIAILGTILVSAPVIILGIFFWYVLIQSVKSAHLLTNSAFTVILSLFFPIIIFSLYLSFCIIFSVFVKNRLLRFLILFLSTGDYFFLTGSGYMDFIGEVVITSSLWYFLLNFDRYDVIVGGKSSITSRVSSAFSAVSLVISLTLAINFYSIYTHSLSSNNLFISNSILGKMLAPVVAIYKDDLKITNPSETFLNYQLRMAKKSKISPTQIKINTLKKLKIQNATDDLLMKDVLKLSLDNSVLQLVRTYGRLIPILISLGLGVIVQTIISISSAISSYVTLLLFLLLRKLKILQSREKNYTIQRDIWIQ